MKTLMIEKMNKENEMYENVKYLFTPYMSNEIAEAKTNEVMRITEHSFAEVSADDICPYCTELRDENGTCQCSNVR